MRTIIIAFIVLSTACTNKKELITETPDKSLQPLAKKVIVDQKYDRSTDAFQIIDAEVVGQQLHINVSYSGGCEGHVFELFTDGHLMKSLPPKQTFFLKHYAHDDACEALVEEKLFFDLEGTASQGNTLILLLQQYDGALRMDF